jgi:predicted amidohydrolase YtcJ
LKFFWLNDADGMARRAGEQGQSSYLEFYRFGLEMTGAAHAAGVQILAGTDTPDSFAFPGTGLHDELDHLVQAGLSPLDALRAATLEPASFLGLEGKAGIIEPGARADLVLLSGNPLDDISAVRTTRTVVLAGTVYDRDDLDALLGGVEKTAGSWSIWPKFIWQMLNSPIMRRQWAD